MNERVFIANKKGLKLAGVLHYPDKDSQYPAVILLHGFTGTKDEKHIEALADELSQNDFVAIRFDVSGSGDSEGKAETEYRIENYLSDTEDIFNYLQNQNFVDSGRIGLWGHSLGGMISTIFGAKNKLVRAICLVFAPTDLLKTQWFKRIVPKWKEVGWMVFPVISHKSVKLPYSAVEEAEKYNTLDYIKKVKIPLLVIAAGKDETIPRSQTLSIYKKASEPKELFEIKELTHNYDTEPGMIKLINQRVIEFFKKSL